MKDRLTRAQQASKKHSEQKGIEKILNKHVRFETKELVDVVCEAMQEYESTNLAKIKELEENTTQLGINFSVTLSGKEAKIRELEAQVPKWISVEDRLPEDYQEVLIYACSKQGLEVLTAMFCDDTDSQFIIHNWNKNMGPVKDIVIIHWQPLPQPPLKPQEK